MKIQDSTQPIPLARVIELSPEASEDNAGQPRTISDTAVAGAMLSLENDVCELKHMAEISCEQFDTMGAPGEGGEIILAQWEREQLAFLINNVFSRTQALRKQFYAACGGANE